MKISNIRFGFATNSSSMHSLAFIEPREKFKDDMLEYEGFGWQPFTLVSPEMKTKYLSMQLMSNLVESLPLNIAKIVTEKWLNVSDLDLMRKKYDVCCSIDHQSVWNLPKNFYSDSIVDEQFFKELTEFIQQPNLMIVGGNDNSDDESVITTSDKFIFDFQDTMGNWKCRKDEINKNWVIFNQQNGTKIRFSFDKYPQKEKVAFSSVPELVDLKITNHCPSNCSFCYMGSTPEGQHAPISSIEAYIEALSHLKVFELAIGGGEPTLHPDFIKILKHAKSLGIVPNFSTHRKDWLKNDNFRGPVLENCGGFAYSTNYYRDAMDFATMINYHRINNSTERATIQTILGLTDKKEFEDILKVCADNNLPLTILGFKPINRGEKFLGKYKLKKFNWIDLVKQYSKEYYVKVGIDTCIANEFKTQLKTNKVSDLLYTTKEGKFSCFIDAVENEIGPSSFCNENQKQKLNITRYSTERNAEMIKTNYLRFARELQESNEVTGESNVIAGE